MERLSLLADLPTASRQILVVSTSPGSIQARVTCWEKINDDWQQVMNTVPAVIGRNGIVNPDAKREGDGRTPLGCYLLGLAFGYAASIDTAMPYRQITMQDYWVDDSESPAYNTWATGAQPSCSHETMLREDGLYRYGLVVEYNTAPVVPGKGSAIFVHLWRAPDAPTAGCVAMAESSLIRILAWLKPQARPLIVISTEKFSCQDL